jgi:pyruvate-ferredoxin/flavodoxin oxidoreductase
VKEGKNPLTLDSRPPKLPVKEYLRMENRFRMLEMSQPAVARELFDEAQERIETRWAFYHYLATRMFEDADGKESTHEH